MKREERKQDLFKVLQFGKHIEEDSDAELGQGRYGRAVDPKSSQNERERICAPFWGLFLSNLLLYLEPPTLGNGSGGV